LGLKASEKLAEEQKAYLRGKRYENEKNKHGGERPSNQNEDLKTSEKLASEYNVSKATIERDADFAKGIDLLPNQHKTEQSGNFCHSAKTETKLAEEYNVIKC